ncbi:Regulator of nonsense transcripts 1 [Seminavis robusta]|uniref:Regulator of nonsense transcripts 1 n=1 Tax=Seminavis robusta TaxID=568900 RepID=A0A9N8HY50_9STRA|nr:Regulator of nonsense transcripts 1 [Seminavis robusta]|eukprot:Sro1933_g306270.1 Regulator of nonsense transcripts 1 (1206) ;mRNA; f:12163-16035
MMNTTSKKASAAAANKKKIKKRGNPILTPAMMEVAKQQEAKETQLDLQQSNENGRFRSPSEAFYVGAILSVSPRDYVESWSNHTTRRTVWKATASVLKLTPPVHSLAGQSLTRRQHCNDRAALVLEESIHVLSEAMAKRWSNRNNHRHGQSNKRSNSNTTMTLELSERTFNSRSQVVFFEFSLPDMAPPFTKEQQFHLRTGTIVECVPANCQHQVDQVLLACICMTKRQITQKARRFVVMTVPENEQRHIRCGLWAVTPLTSLVSEFRQLDTCNLIRSGHAPLPFLQTLLGQQQKSTKAGSKQPVVRVLDLSNDTTTAAAATVTVATTNKEKSKTATDKMTTKDKGGRTGTDKTRTIEIVLSSDDDESDSDDDSDSDNDSTKETDGAKKRESDNDKNDNDIIEISDNNTVANIPSTPPPTKRQYNIAPPQSPMRVWSLPNLNSIQAKAAADFLDSPTGSISLVQGPPGTGKTTFLVSTIGQYLQRLLAETEAEAIARGETPHLTRSPPHYAGRRCKKGKALMVAAPTNKAVSVLASRFMSTISGEKKGANSCHELKVILVGDAEKLVEDTPIYSKKNQGDDNNNNSIMSDNDIVDHASLKETIKSMACLKRIFVYRFLENIEEEVKTVLGTLRRNRSQNNSNPPKSEQDDDNDDNEKDQTNADNAKDDNGDSNESSYGERNYKMQRYSLLRLVHQYVDIGYVFPQGYQARGELLRDTLLKMSHKDFRSNTTTPASEKQVKLFEKRLDHVLGDVQTLIHTRDIGQRVILALIRSADLIFCTLATSGSAIFKSRDRPFKIRDLIVDEAAAATEPQIGIPFHMCPDRLLAVGDPMQLPATVFSPVARQYGLDKSLHERLMKDCKYPYTMLRQQYRMRPQISQFPSKTFYRGKLKDGDEVISDTYVSPRPLLQDPQRPFVFQEVLGEEKQREGGSYMNRAEAEAVVHRIRQLRDKAAGQDPNWFRNDKVRIITFYQAQVDLINSLLNPLGFGKRKSGLVASTVDSSQGCEANLVLVSFVRTCRKRHRNHVGDADREAFARSVAGFLTDNRRLNVALTRAKFELICIGSASHMLENEHLETLHAFAKQCQARGCIIESPLGVVSPNVTVAALDHRNGQRKRQGTGDGSNNPHHNRMQCDKRWKGQKKRHNNNHRTHEREGNDAEMAHKSNERQGGHRSGSRRKKRKNWQNNGKKGEGKRQKTIFDGGPQS